MDRNRMQQHPARGEMRRTRMEGVASQEQAGCWLRYWVVTVAEGGSVSQSGSALGAPSFRQGASRRLGVHLGRRLSDRMHHTGWECTWGAIF